MQLDGRKCWMRRNKKITIFPNLHGRQKKKEIWSNGAVKKSRAYFREWPNQEIPLFLLSCISSDIDAAIQLNLQRPGRCFLFDGLLSASLQNVQSRLWCVTDLEQFCHHHHFSVGRIAKVENLSSFNRRDALTTDIKEPIRLDCAYGYFHVSPVMEMREKKHTHIGRCGERGDEDLPLEMFRDI